MTMTETANGTRYSDDQARAAALAWLERGGTATGAELGVMFPHDTGPRSERWGRKMLARHAAGTAPVPGTTETGTGNGTSSGGSAPAPARQRATVSKPRRRAAAPAPEPPKGRDPSAFVATVVVGMAAAAWSAAHTVHLAQMAGFGRWSYVVPVTIDGLIFVCGRHLRTVDGYWVAKLGLALGILGTLAANLLAIDPALVELENVRRVMALAPPVAFVVCVHLLERGHR